jgi:hypothetical protein
MVFYFKSLTHPNIGTIFMPKGVNEAKELFLTAKSNDIWFTTKDYACLDIYLRIENIDNIEAVPTEVIREIAQLVKVYSPEGSKRKQISILYSFTSNLIKHNETVTFKNKNHCKIITGVSRDSSILNLLRKTKSAASSEMQDLHVAKVKRIYRVPSTGRPFMNEKSRLSRKDPNVRKSVNDFMIVNKRKEVE